MRFVHVWAKPSRARFGKIAKQATGDTDQALLLLLLASAVVVFGTFLPSDGFLLFSSLTASFGLALILVVWIFVLYKVLGWMSRFRKLNYEGLLALVVSILVPLSVLQIVSLYVPSSRWLAYASLVYALVLFAMASWSITKLPAWKAALSVVLSLVLASPALVIVPVLFSASFNLRYLL